MDVVGGDAASSQQPVLSVHRRISVGVIRVGALVGGSSGLGGSTGGGNMLLVADIWCGFSD